MSEARPQAGEMPDWRIEAERLKVVLRNSLEPRNSIVAALVSAYRAGQESREAEILLETRKVLSLLQTTTTERDSLQQRLTVAEEALNLYANSQNWQCARCKGADHVNCFMGRWVGPVGDHAEECGSGDSACLCELHGYAIARAALARIQEPKPKEEPHV